jgi:D-arabinose 1-dehydrogenase-like Zn-dependent alcohol dehydrogenase
MKTAWKHQNSFDFILNTIPVGHEMDPYLGLLKIDATMVLVGAVEPWSHFMVEISLWDVSVLLVL